MRTSLQIARNELLDIELALTSLPEDALAATILIARRAELVAKITRLENELPAGWSMLAHVRAAGRLPVLVLSGLLLLSLLLPWFDFVLFDLTGLDVLRIALQAGDITDVLRFFITLSPALLIALRLSGILILVAVVARVAAPLLTRSGTLVGISSGSLLLLPVTALLMSSPELLRNLEPGFWLFALPLVALLVLDTRRLATEHASMAVTVRTIVTSIGLIGIAVLGVRGSLDHASVDWVHLVVAIVTLVAAALIAQRSPFAMALAAAPVVALAAFPDPNGSVILGGSVAVTGALVIGLLASRSNSDHYRRGSVMVVTGVSVIGLLLPTLLSVGSGAITSLRERDDQASTEIASAAPTPPVIRNLPMEPGPRGIADPAPVFDLARAPTQRFAFGGAGDAGIESGLLLAHGRLYLADNYGRLYAIDATSGTEEWRVDVGGPVWSRLTINGDRLLLSEGDGDLVLVDVVQGTVLDRWRIGRSTQAMSFGHNHVATDDRVIVTTIQGLVQARDAATGTIHWQVELGEPLDWQSATVHNGLVLVPSDRGTIHALDLSDGNTIWRFPTGGFGGPRFAFFENSILALSPNSTLYAIDRRTGTERWRQPVTGWNSSPVAVMDGLVIAGGESNLHAFDVRDGQPKWVAPLAEAGGLHYPTTLIRSDDVVLVDAEDGLVGLRRSDGSVLWRSGIWTAMEPILADGVLYVKTPNAGVVALEFRQQD